MHQKRICFTFAIFFDINLNKGLAMQIFYKSLRYLLGMLLPLFLLTSYQGAYANNLGISDAQINQLLSISSRSIPRQQLSKTRTRGRAKDPRFFNIKFLGKRVINSARQLLNVPYVWGGTTPRGFDCSGLVQYIYRNEGVRLPRTAAQQYKSMRKIKREYAAKGDLIFFNMKRGRRYVDHVGIYMGNGQFIHAPGRGKHVKMSKLSSFWKKKMVGVGRAI